jgi:hypothetical protein
MLETWLLKRIAHWEERRIQESSVQLYFREIGVYA